MTKRQISIAIDRSLLACLDQECGRQERSRSYIACLALRRLLARGEEARGGEGEFDGFSGERVMNEAERRTLNVEL